MVDSLYTVVCSAHSHTHVAHPKEAQSVCRRHLLHTTTLVFDPVSSLTPNNSYSQPP
jgi:hypothetical protein